LAKQYPVNPIPGEIFAPTDLIWIAAGGPSLRALSWERLEGKKVIAINRAMYKVPHAKIVYWSDDRFWEENKGAINAHAAPFKVTAYSDLVRFVYPKDIFTYKFTRLRGYDDSAFGLCTGNNSGYSSINLAVKLGARRVVLLGYDFSYSACGESHWHEGYFLPDGSRRTHREVTLTHKMLPFFESLREPLQKMRVTVYNANPQSSLKVWPRISIEEALTIA